MRVAIHQPNVLPWLGFFGKLAQADLWIVLDDVTYSRGSYTNRVQIASRADRADPAGPEWLTLAVRHTGDAARSIRDTRLATLATIDAAKERLYSAYIDAPHGPVVLRNVFSMWDNARSNAPGSLVSANVSAIAYMTQALGITLRHGVAFASQIRANTPAEPGDKGLVQLMRAVGGTSYIAGGGGGAEYHEPDLWAQAGISWVPSRFRHPRYDGSPCEWPSAIDVLARLGPDGAKALLAAGLA